MIKELKTIFCLKLINILIEVLPENSFKLKFCEFINDEIMTIHE